MENNKIIIWAIVSLLVGFAIGFYYGNTTGKSEGILIGKQEVLDQQNAEEEAKLQAIQEEANPFTEVEEVANPFKDTYKNPFE